VYTNTRIRTEVLTVHFKEFQQYKVITPTQINQAFRNKGLYRCSWSSGQKLECVSAAVTLAASQHKASNRIFDMKTWQKGLKLMFGVAQLRLAQQTQIVPLLLHC